MEPAAIRETIVKILALDFRIPEAKISDDATFRGTFGMDSLDAVDFIFLVKKTFEIEPELHAFSKLNTVKLLVSFLESELAKASPSKP